jgi:hypothetical protein
MEINNFKIPNVDAVVMFKHVYSDTVFSGKHFLFRYIEHTARICG